jgi:hypothetical protein
MKRNTYYPQKSIEQQMREQAFRTKQPTDWSMVMLVVCLILVLSSVSAIIYCAIKLHH